jgi:hypothetical protein
MCFVLKNSKKYFYLKKKIFLKLKITKHTKKEEEEKFDLLKRINIKKSKKYIKIVKISKTSVQLNKHVVEAKRHRKYLYLQELLLRITFHFSHSYYKLESKLF